MPTAPRPRTKAGADGVAGPPPGDVLAAIDVGTNSFHLVVARVIGDRAFDVLTQEKEMVRLGRGGGDMKELSSDAMDRGVAALARMRRIAAASGAPVRAVATSAVREAANHDVFIRRARDEAGVEVEVISGTEEARLIHLGVLQALPVFDRHVFLCDIGGGSTELLLGHRGGVRAARSLKLGAVRLTDRFFGTGRPDKASLEACRGFVRSLVWPFHREVETHGFDVFVASSGTAEAVASIAHAATGRPPVRTFNGYVVGADEVHEVVERIVSAQSAARRVSVDGLDPKRADIILAGALVLEGVLDAFDVEDLTISGYALREGVLLDTLQRRQGGTTLHHLSDLARDSVQRLADQCDEEPGHSAHVARLALRLFDETARLHGLDASCREYLEAGALLANVGLFVSHSQHHLHSYYLIRHSDRLVGLTDGEIEIVAQVARYHRKSSPKERHPEFAALDPVDRDVVRALAGVLRVAIGLDRGHVGHVVDVRARATRSRLVIEVVAADGADIGLELFAANERRELLEEVVGRTVEIRAAS